MIETLQYRFKPTKSHHAYIVRVERYKDHAYCLKFFDKANMNSKLKFSLRTNTFEPRTIFYTLFRIMLDVLNRDEKASFFFVGAEDENDELGKATRRFRIYKKFTSSVVSENLFEHYAIEAESLYILINKKSTSDCDEMARRITIAVKQLFSTH